MSDTARTYPSATKPALSVLLAILISWHASPIWANDGFTLRDYRGKVVYVDFWASWCIPCRASFPFMSEMVDKYGDDLAIIAINVDEDGDDAAEFLSAFTTNFEIVYDPQGKLAESFDVKGMPMSYLYDRDGNLLGTHIGFRKKDRKTLEQVISDAIAQ